MAVLEFGVMHPNLPHWASAKRAEGVRFSTFFDHSVKRWLTELNAGCQGVGEFLREVWRIHAKAGALSAFGGRSGAGSVRLPLQNKWFGHLTTFPLQMCHHLPSAK